MIAILFGSIFGGSNGTTAIKIALEDQDGSKQSADLVKRISSSTAVSIQKLSQGKTAAEAVQKGELAAYVLIPKGYGEAASKFQYATGPAIQVGIDPSRQAEAGMLQGVVAEAAYGGMASTFSNPIDMKTSTEEGLAALKNSQNANDARTVDLLTALNRYYATPTPAAQAGNSEFSFQGPKIESVTVKGKEALPAKSFEYTFPQAILWGLLGVMSTFAISMVKERNQGTLIRLRVSPLSFFQILAGKGLACFIAAACVMIALLAVGKLLFNIHLGSPLLLALGIGSSAFAMVGIMLLLSVLGKTEPAVAGSSWGVMITMAMFGGGMIPVFVMPPWMQTASNFSPLKWTSVAIEGAIWRGYSLQEMLLPCGVLLGVGLVTFIFGVWAVQRSASSPT
jgi:ABC-2 type transport system permease protein